MQKAYWIIKFPLTSEYAEYLSPTALASIYNILDVPQSSLDRGTSVLNVVSNEHICLRQPAAFKFTDRHEAYHISDEINKCFKAYCKYNAMDLKEYLEKLSLRCKVIRVYPKFPALTSKVTKKKVERNK